MAIQSIRIFGDPVLRTPAAEVVDFDKELHKLVADLMDTMEDAPGVGLAAPQLGVSLRVFTYWVDEELGHLVNPTLKLSDDIELGEEGCLSLPGRRFYVKRPYRIVASWTNVVGHRISGAVLHGASARIFQHEHDHLRGVTLEQSSTKEI